MNFNERLLQGYDLGRKTPKLHGQTRLDLLRKGKVIKRVEKHNEITGWIGNALSAGNFFNQVQADKIYPLSQWFSGCYLTDATNDANLAMIAGNSNIVAQAGNDAYSGLNLKRGSFNAVESGSGVNNGKCYIRNVWDWNTSQGNCAQGQSIASVCLTRGEMGKIDLNDSTTALDMVAFNPLLGSSSFTYPPFHAMNPATGKVYFVDYTSGDTKIVVTERFTNTNKIHLLGGVAGDIESESHEVPISAAIPSFSNERASVNLDVANGILHFYTWATSGSGSSQVTTLYDYAINTADFESTVTATTLTIQGCHFISGYGYNYIRGSVILNDWNGHIWAMADVNGTTKFIKVTISNLDVDEYPVILSANGEWWRDNAAPFLLLNNGDWIKYSGNENRNPMVAWYYHNGVISYVRNAWNRNLSQYVAVDLGGVFLESYEYDNTVRVVSGFPYVSTVNNLQNPVRKTSDLSMKLTYTITEV